ncbi:ABC transporter ATP-binding protein [Liquorilactobacillus cacaonum]|uniref:ABC transporter ATP-binding protein n=1 Tax=Liquorilactobacillus cacaonum DSM 21116 TaxID=1423729 RepID=A0A0R2CTI4_9LACO|nr:ABC transporter ATP-binding protein [Liquorilactobacillus cacaonum]KRM90963.1 ABC transporter ATP-binding protein [Liquorilactobacillus cacaonum DSM 21116]
MTQKLLEIINVGKSYGQSAVLSNASLSISEGEFIALVGMSGGGKSTLLRMLAGLEDVSSGDIIQDGIKLEGLNKSARVMFQEDRLLPWMNVLENVMLDKRNREQRAEALQLLKQVELEDYVQQFPTQLSGGQRQRVALARALMAHPRLLLLDEPLGALDALTRGKMQNLIHKVCQNKSITTFLVTHDINEAVRMADRIAIIKNGTIWRTIDNPYRGKESIADKEKEVEISEKILAEILN